MHTSPLTASRYPDSSDSPAGPQQIQNAVLDLEGSAIPQFANATARTAAYNAWTATGKTLVEGMTCFMQDENRYYIYDGAAWNWPRWSQGRLGYASRSSQAGPVTTTAFVAVSGLSVSFTVASTRQVMYVYNGQSLSTAVGTMNTRLRNTTTGLSKAGTSFIGVANWGAANTIVMHEQLTAGTYTVVVEIAHGTVDASLSVDPADLIVLDTGAP